VALLSFSKHRHEFLIFSILFLVSFSQVYYQFSVWETIQSRELDKSWALFSGDEPHYLVLTSVMVRHNSLHIDDFIDDPQPDPNLLFPDYVKSNCRSYHSLTANDGHCYTIHGIGLSILLFPGYAIGGFVGAMVTMNLFFALQGVLFFKFSLKFTSKKISFFSGLLFSLGTILLSFSSEIYPELIVGFLLFLVLYLFFYKNNSFSNMLIIGSILGFLPFLKIPFMIFPLLLLPIMMIVLLKNKKKKNIIPLIGIFLIFLLGFFVYQIVTEPIEKAPGFGGKHGVPLLEKVIKRDIPTITIHGLLNFIFSQNYGLFIFSPLTLLGIGGIGFLWTKNKILTLTIAILISSLTILYAITLTYAAGWTLPSRYLIPILPLFFIPFILLCDKFSKNIFLYALIGITSYIGLRFNLVFASIIYGHLTQEHRASIANDVYFGASQILPYSKIASYKWGLEHFWSDISPLFWFILFFVIFSLGIFIYNYRSNTRKINSLEKKIIFSIFFSLVIVSFFLYYPIIYENQVKSDITAIYNEILLREPDPEGINHWKNFIINESKSIDWVKEQLLNSEEGKITTQIAELYRKILLREPDPEGINHWKNFIINENKSIDWVKEQLLNSEEGNLMIKQLINK